MKEAPPILATTFGSRVRDLRKEKGWSIRVFAHKAGCHWSFVGQVERGERNVSLRTVVRFAYVLEVDPGDLLRGMRWSETGDG